MGLPLVSLRSQGRSNFQVGRLAAQPWGPSTWTSSAASARQIANRFTPTISSSMGASCQLVHAAAGGLQLALRHQLFPDFLRILVGRVDGRDGGLVAARVACRAAAAGVLLVQFQALLERLERLL